MASWSEEEEVEGSGRRGGREEWVGGWVGGGSLRNWSPPFSAEIFESCGSFQAAALWQKKKRKKKESSQQQYDWTLFQCLNRDERASDVAHSVDTPHRGDLTEMKRRPRCFIMKLLVLWEKAIEPQWARWLTSAWDSLCVLVYWRDTEPQRGRFQPESLHKTSRPLQHSLGLIFWDRTATCGLVRRLWYDVALALLHMLSVKENDVQLAESTDQGRLDFRLSADTEKLL